MIQFSPTQPSAIKFSVILYQLQNDGLCCRVHLKQLHKECSSVSQTITLHFYFLQLHCPDGIFPTGHSVCFPRGKPAATESRYPTYCACWVFLCCHNPPNSDMDYRIFNVRTDVNACYGTPGCANRRKKVCTES